MVHGIVIVEPSDLYRACLDSLLSQYGDLRTLASERDFNLAKLSVSTLRPRLVLVGTDTSTACVTDFVQMVKRAEPEVRIIAVDYSGQDANVRAMMQAGADGYVSKQADQMELVAAIRSAFGGRRYCSANQAAAVLADALPEELSNRQAAARNVLTQRVTQRECEVMQLAAVGKTNMQIAEQLGIALSTVEKHRYRIFRKLAVKNLAELTAYALVVA